MKGFNPLIFNQLALIVFAFTSVALATNKTFHFCSCNSLDVARELLCLALSY